MLLSMFISLTTKATAFYQCVDIFPEKLTT